MKEKQKDEWIEMKGWIEVKEGYEEMVDTWKVRIQVEERKDTNT